jgi:long-chain acyl-CoA synthetase
MSDQKLGFWAFTDSDPDALALVDPSERKFTRGELMAASNRIANAFQEMGLKTGDSVAVMLPNCAEFLIINLAVAQMGLYLVPINWHLAADEVAYITADSEAKVFISHEQSSEAAAGALKQMKLDKSCVFGIGNMPGFTPFEQLGADCPEDLPSERTAGSVMNYTSGTTGKPKGVRRPLTGLDPNTAGELFTFTQQMFGIKPADGNVHITGSPLYHTAVLVWAMSSFHMGHPVVLMEKWEAEDMLRLIDKYKVTHSHMVPTQFRRLLLLPEKTRNQYSVSSLRYMIHAAAPCPPEIKRQMLDWWGKTVYEYYAATEGGGTVATPEEWLENPGTVGKAWPMSDVKILDDNGKEMPVGKEGTVYMLTNKAMRFEYRGDNKKTKDSYQGDYFTVGDIGFMNEGGYLFLCDRKIDMIISGGANIYPVEIENVLIQHPKVEDVAVFGIPHEDWGEEIKAVVQPIQGVEGNTALNNEILAFCEGKLAKMKWPKSIDYTEQMPRDPNGKLYKRRLRDPYWEGKKRQV